MNEYKANLQQQEDIKVNNSNVFANNNIYKSFSNSNNTNDEYNNNDNDDNDNDDDEANQGFFHKLNQKPISKPTEKESVLKKNKDNKTNKTMLNKKRNRDDNKKKFKTGGNKRQICQFYINGACNKGDKCPYSHRTEQIHKKELCKFFLSGNCAKKDKCLYSHILSEYPCKFFHARGFCENFDKCRFSHDRLSDDAIFPFIKENEQFLFEVREKYGVTNMDDFFNYYLKEKNALPDNAMIPECIKDNNNTNVNANETIVNETNYIPSGIQLNQREIIKMHQRIMEMNNAMIDNKLPEVKGNNDKGKSIEKKLNINKSPPLTLPLPPPILLINPFKHPKENEEEQLKNIITFIKGTNDNKITHIDLLPQKQFKA